MFTDDQVKICEIIYDERTCSECNKREVCSVVEEIEALIQAEIKTLQTVIEDVTKKYKNAIDETKTIKYSHTKNESDAQIYFIDGQKNMKYRIKQAIKKLELNL